MFVLYSLSMPRTVAPNKLSNKSSLTDCSDGTTFSRLDSMLNTLVYQGKERMSLLKEGVVSPSEKLLHLCTKRHIQACPLWNCLWQKTLESVQMPTDQGLDTDNTLARVLRLKSKQMNLSYKYLQRAFSKSSDLEKEFWP